jgi:uncharacterized cofD-like protein
MKKVVVIGGGSGIFNVLKGLKNYPVSITSIVTTFDNGGSTGILRDEFGTLPQGDIRRSLVALAPDTGDSLLRDMFNFRFPKDSSLHGHSFGNLFLQALGSITGNEVSAIKKASDILNIKHRILPVSIDNSSLRAELSDGSIIYGETNIDIPKHDGEMPIRKLYLEPSANIFSESFSAIQEADLVIIGPGDLYTSILPNVLTKGFTEAIKNTKIMYISNIMTKWGETNGYSARDFTQTLTSYLERDKVEYIVVNTGSVSPAQLVQYAEQKCFPVRLDKKELMTFAEEVIEDNFVLESETERIVRHDPQKIARVIMNLI